MFTHARVKFELQPTGFLDTTVRLGREMAGSRHAIRRFHVSFNALSRQLRIPYYLIGCLEHCLFSPYIWNNHPNWLIFSRGVETTNQLHVWLTHSCTSSFSIVASILRSESHERLLQRNIEVVVFPLSLISVPGPVVWWQDPKIAMWVRVKWFSRFTPSTRWFVGPLVPPNFRFLIYNLMSMEKHSKQYLILTHTMQRYTTPKKIEASRTEILGYCSCIPRHLEKFCWKAPQIH